MSGPDFVPSTPEEAEAYAWFRHCSEVLRRTEAEFLAAKKAYVDAVAALSAAAVAAMAAAVTE